ncbi:hypothetical protein [Primorskyibacter marinus]|uniref:hypothetical protein n=1 Tax=Primorskyibacter marinus TaxID=1977320 RepID=UPI000E30866C|nr:hypothetical protein [Primorskyibacter marinus]
MTDVAGIGELQTRTCKALANHGSGVMTEFGPVATMQAGDIGALTAVAGQVRDLQAKAVEAT